MFEFSYIYCNYKRYTMNPILNIRALRILVFFTILFGSQNIIAQNCSVNAGVPETICENSTYSLSGAASGLLSSTPTWSQTGGPLASIEDPANLNTAVSGLIGGNAYTFRLSANCTDGSSVFQEVTINVEPITIADAGNDLESCPDSGGAVVASANSPQNSGETGSWSIDGSNDAGVVINFPNSPTTTLTLPETSAGTTTLRWTIRGPDFAPGQFCESYDTITVTNIGGEQPVSAGANQTLDNCYTVSQSTTLQGSFGGNNINGQIGTWSFVSGPSTPNILSPNHNQTGVSDLTEGTYTFRWSVSGPCANGTDTMTITVPAATQDITDNSTASTIRICDPSVDSVTLVGSSPEFTNETLQWTQVSGPTAGVNIVSPNEVSTRVTGLASPNTYIFQLTTLNSTTGCDDVDQVTINYSPDPISITANGGNDIVGECGILNVDIPFTTTGEGQNTYSIINGPSGSSLVDSNNYSNTGSSPLNIDFDVEGTYTVLFRRAVGGEQQLGCTQGTDEIQVTVSRVPTPANAGTNQTLACNVTTTSVAGNTPSVGTAIWSQIEGPSTATIDDPYSGTTDISDLIPGTYIFRYTISGGPSCSDPVEDDVQILVSSSSPVPTDAGDDENVCYGGPVVLDAEEAPNASLIGTWSVDSAPAGATITFEDENDPATTVFGLDDPDETYVLRWTVANPSDPVCPSSGSDTVTINTNAIQGPSVADAGPDQCLPSGTTSTSLSGNEPLATEQGMWSAVPSTGISFVDASQYNTSVSISVEQSYILTWTISTLDPSCQDATDEVEVTVAPPISANAGPDQEVCSDTVTMAASTSSGATGVWTQLSGPGGVSIDDDTSPTAEFTFTYSGIYNFEWTASNGSCMSASDQISVSVGIPSSIANAGTDQTICSGSQATLGANAFDETIESGYWSVLPGSPNTPVFSDNTDPNAVISNLVTGIYNLQWNITSGPPCSTSTDQVEIGVFSPADAGDDQSYCETNNFILEATAGSLGSWVQIDGPGVNGNPGTPADILQQPTNSHVANVTVFSSAAYTFEFTTDYGGTCPVTSDQVVVSTSLPPSVDPDAGSDQVLCIGDLNPAGTTSLNGNAAPVDVTNAEWRFSDQPSGSVAVIDTPNDPNTTVSGLTVPGIYILEWNFEVNNCTNLADVVRLEVYEAPSAANAGPDQTAACQVTAQLDAVPPSTGIGTWTFENPGDDPSGGTAIIDSPNSPTSTISNITTLGTYVLTWTVSNGNAAFSDSPSSCDPSVDTVSITFSDDVPSDADAGPDQELCAETQTNLNAVPVTSGTGTWTQTDGPGVSGNPGNSATITSPNNPQALILNLEPGVYEFTWTTSNGGCDFEDTMELVIQEHPTAANAGADQSVAQFTPVNLAATPVSAGEGIWTQVSGPSQANLVDDTDPATEVLGTQVGTYEFRWTVSSGNCPSTTDTMILEVTGIADLELTKTVSTTSANAGDTVTFTISIFNNNTNGGANATGVSVRDVLPNGYDLVLGTVSNNGVYNPGNFTINWSDLTINNGATLNLTFDATVNESGNYLNSAQIMVSNESDPDSTPNNNIGSEDDQDTAEVLVQSADLSLSKTVSPSSVSVGDTVTFYLEVSNAGTDDAAGVVIQDVVPVGYTVVSINNGGTQSGNTIIWSGLSVSNGGSTTVSFTASVNAPSGAISEYLNTAQITASNQVDPDSEVNNDDGDQSEDDEDTATVTLEQIDLELDITNAVGTGNEGDVIDYTVSVFNNDAVATGDARGVQAVVILPSGLSIVTGSISNGGVYNPGSGAITWSDLTITNGATQVLNYQVTVNSNGNFTTVGEISASDMPDIDSTPNNDDGDQSEDDEANVSFSLQSADLSLTKDISATSSDTPNIGDTIFYELTVTNDGPDTATNVRVEDEVPSGLSLVAINNGGTAIAGTFLSWDIPSLPVGSTTVTYEVTVNQPNGFPDEYVNIAEVTASDQADVDSEPFNDDGDQSEDDEDFYVVTPQVVDLELEISVSDANPNVGDTVTFSITIDNLGEVAASGVGIENIVPSGFGNISAISNGGSFGSGSITWSGLSVPVGNSTLVLTFNADVLAPTGAAQEYIHVVQVTAADQFDLDSSPNNDDGDQSEDEEDAVALSPQQADLSLVKTVSDITPDVGDTVVYTLTINNLGPNVATGVAIEDVLPSGLTLTTVNNGGAQSGNTATWSGLSVLANGGSTSVTYEATVNAPTGTLNEYQNRAQITAGDQFDPDSNPSTDHTVDEDSNGDGDDDDEDTLTISPNIGDLELTKIVVDGDTTPLVGSEISFEITVFNVGTVDADDVVVQDVLPSGYDFVLYSATSGIYNEGTGVWQVGDVSAGGTETIVIDVLVNATGDYTNVAEIIASNIYDVDSTPNNNILSEDDQDDVVITPVEITDLSLTKTVDNSSPDVNDVVVFTITVNNDGPSDATGIQVSDLLPSGFTYVSDDSGGTYNDGTGNWAIPALVNGASAVLNINASVNTTGDYTNVAEIIAHDQLDEDSTPNNTTPTEDDQDQVVVVPRQLVDISVSKAADTNTPNMGGTIVFTVSVANDGPSDATNVVVTDLLESGYEFISSTASNGSYQPLNGSWTIGSLANGTTETLTIEATVVANGNYINMAELTDLNEEDVDSVPGNNNAAEDDQATIEPEPVMVSDLSLTKVVDNSSPSVGEMVVFILNVTNSGPSDASGVVVEDIVPSGYSFNSFNSTAGTYDETTGIWSLNGTLPNGTTETLEISATVNPIGDYLNVAEIVASDNADLDSTPGNSTISEDDYAEALTTPVAVADVSLTKTVDNEFPDVSDQVTFTLSLNNAGPSNASNIQVIDLLPSGYTYVSDDSGGAYNPATGEWSIASLAADNTSTIAIVAEVNATGSYLNNAELVAVNEQDPDSNPNNNILSEDDQDEQSTQPRVVTDISVQKSIDNSTPAVGSTVSFTVQVTNDGPSDATGLVIEDVLASGYQFVSATTSTGNYDDVIGSWNINTLANGGTETLVIDAVVLSNGNYANTAELIALDTFDSDSTPDNNLNSEDDQDTVNPVPTEQADLSLTKAVDNATPFVGETVEFTINVTNNGPSDTSGVSIEDVIPDGYTYVSHNSTAGLYNETNGIWSLNGTLSNGTTETLEVRVSVNPSGNYLNVAEIISASATDPDSTPGNSVSVEDDYTEALTNPIPIADLSLTNTVDNEFPDVSDQVTFTLTLRNDGPSEATGIQVMDLLPNGYSYISDNSGGTYNPTTGVWNVSNLAADNLLELEITADINVTGIYINEAEIIAANELDPDSTPGNNVLSEDDQDEQATLPRVITDISVVKSVDNAEPSVGSTINFTIEVTNDGPSDATGLVIEDILASGYDFVSANTSVGAYDEIIGSWDIASLPNGMSQTLVITATVLSNGDYSNTAELIALNTFDPDSSPDNNLNSEDDQDTVNPRPTGLADLSIALAIDDTQPNVSDVLELTLNVTNSGDSNASGVVISELLPLGLSYEAHTATAGTYDETTGIWSTNGAIPNGTTETLIILARVNAPTGAEGEYTNEAQITASNQADPDSNASEGFDLDDLGDGLIDDDEARVEVTPQSVDIAIGKTVNVARPNIGQEISFTVTATNNGMLNATNIGIDELLPTGYRFISANATAGTYDAGEGFWELNELGPGELETLTLTVEVLDIEDYQNVASLAYVDQFDLNASNDSGSATIQPTCLVFYNKFSPNGDGVNETFVIDCISRYPNNTLKIYNRWGNLVYEAYGYHNEFEGISNGRATIQKEELLPAGTYFYVLDLGDGSDPINDWLYINR